MAKYIQFVKDIKQQGVLKALWNLGFLHTVILASVMVTMIIGLFSKSNDHKRAPASTKKQIQTENK